MLQISAIAGINDPQLKVTPTGFLQMLLENGANAKVVNQEALAAGREQQIKIRYMQRGLESEVDDLDDCNTPISPEWKEDTIKRTQFSKIGIYIADDTMRKLQTEASQKVEVGSPATPLMLALYQTILVKMNGLIQKINTNLLTALAASTVRFTTSVKLLRSYGLPQGIHRAIGAGRHGGEQPLRLHPARYFHAQL